MQALTDNSALASRRLAVVVLEQSAQPLAAFDLRYGHDIRWRLLFFPASFLA